MVDKEWKRGEKEGKEEMENHLFIGREEVVCDIITRGSEVKNYQAESSLVGWWLFSLLFFDVKLEGNVIEFALEVSLQNSALE